MGVSIRPIVLQELNEFMRESLEKLAVCQSEKCFKQTLSRRTKCIFSTELTLLRTLTVDNSHRSFEHTRRLPRTVLELVYK